MASGEFCDGIYQNMAAISEWMKRNGSAIKAARPLPAGETASVPATASGSTRYLFALPQFRAGGAYQPDLLPPRDLTLTLTGAGNASKVILTSDESQLKHDFSGNTLTIQLPAAKRSQLVDVVRVEMERPADSALRR